MNYAIALDIGTTNLQAALLDARTGAEVDYLVMRNSQAVYGADIITRLAKSLKEKSLREKIRASLVNDIALIAGFLLKHNALDKSALKKIAACGNSAMHHLLLGLPLENLARAPFRPSYTNKIFTATLEKLGIKNVSDSAPFMFLPNLGGFVGSDALSVIVDTEMYKSEKAVLAIDLGTNGEIMLGSKNGIVVASTSAGPAFEGWHANCGVPGSAIIDMISDLRASGTISKSGSLAEKKTVYRFGNKDVEVTQNDVREFQLAKAAISAAISVVRRNFKGEIDKIYITGLFGSKLNKENARKIGILPDDISLNRVFVKERSALNGVTRLLKSKNISSKLKSITSKITHVELHKEPDFQEAFVSSIEL